MGVEIDQYELEQLRRDAAKYGSDKAMVQNIARGVALVIVAIVLVLFAWKGVSPQLNLYRANTEKQAVITEQRAQSEAAEFAAISAVTQAEAKAEAMIIEAKALAESQAIIAETLTPEYVQYLYVQAIKDNPNQVIYIPTEAGMPVLEAGRSVTATVTP